MTAILRTSLAGLSPKSSFGPVLDAAGKTVYTKSADRRQSKKWLFPTCPCHSCEGRNPSNPLFKLDPCLRRGDKVHTHLEIAIVDHKDLSRHFLSLPQMKVGLGNPSVHVDLFVGEGCTGWRSYMG
jgi:hypothetical protein